LLFSAAVGSSVVSVLLLIELAFFVSLKCRNNTFKNDLESGIGSTPKPRPRFVTLKMRIVLEDPIIPVWNGSRWHHA